MSAFEATSSFRRPLGLSGALRTFSHEAVALTDALLHPRRIVDEVEQWRSLRLEADRVAERDPQHAADLRRRAARIGSR